MTIKELLEGKEINHVKFGKGVIQTVTDNNAVKIQFKDGEKSLMFQVLTNQNIMTFTDPGTLKDLEACIEGKEIEYKITRVGTTGNEIKNGVDVLRVEDDIRGERRDQLLNSVFGIRKWPSQKSYWHIGNGYYIWLPCIAEYYQGEYHATDADGKWINYFEDNNQTIIQKRADGSPMEYDGKNPKTFVFARDKGEYVYYGVFQGDPEASDEDHSVSRLVECETDLTPWKQA